MPRPYNYVALEYRGTYQGFVNVGDYRLGFSDHKDDGKVYLWTVKGWRPPQGDDLEKAIAAVRRYVNDVLEMELVEAVGL